MNKTTHILRVWLSIAVLIAAAPVTAVFAQDDYVPEQLVCQLMLGYEMQQIHDTYGTNLIAYLPEISTYLLATPPGSDIPALATEIEASGMVTFCQPNFILDAPEAVQSSQPFIDLQATGDFHNQLASTTLDLSEAQAINTGSDVTVGVIDVGVNMTHPELAGNVNSGFDYVAVDSIAADEPGGAGSGHGTFIAGVVNLVAPDALILAYRVLDTNGRGNGYILAESVVQAVNNGCKVINLSVVMNEKHPALDMAIEYAHNNNVMVVAAAGNDGADVDKFPAEDSYTLSVAAVDSLGVKADFSNYGGKVDICAPGTGIYAPYLDTTYAWWNGTSFAAPFVAAQAALLYSLFPSATWDQIKAAILETADNIDPINPGLEDMLGSGLINPVAALEYMIQLNPYMCGDANGDGTGPDIVDLVYLVDFMFGSGPPPPISAAADVDGTAGGPDITDLVYFVDFSFHNGAPLNCGQ